MDWFDEMMETPSVRGMSARDSQELRVVLAMEGCLVGSEKFKEAREALDTAMGKATVAFRAFSAFFDSNPILVHQIRDLETAEAVEGELATREDWNLPDPTDGPA